MGITIFDVAREAGVSKATVSRAFTNPAAVHSETLLRIQNAAHTLNYRPNAVARAMITKRTGNFAFIIYGEQAPVITNPFYGPILESIIKCAGDIGHSMFIASDNELRTSSGELMLQKQVDGIIFSSQPNLDMVHNARRSGVPMVFINHQVEDSYCMLCDDTGGITQAMRHLHVLGHCRIGFLAGTFTDFVRGRRMAAYRSALATLELPAHEPWILEARPTIQHAHEAMAAMLKGGDLPTAMVCANDTIAAGAIKAAVHFGLRVPQDISITGFDNSAYCAVCEPELTSIDPHKEEMGALAVECLMAQIDGRHWPTPVTTLKSELIVRGSTAPCAD